MPGQADRLLCDDAEGWLHAGDLGSMEAQGRLQIGAGIARTGGRRAAGRLYLADEFCGVRVIPAVDVAVVQVKAARRDFPACLERVAPMTETVIKRGR